MHNAIAVAIPSLLGAMLSAPLVQGIELAYPIRIAPFALFTVPD